VRRIALAALLVVALGCGALAPGEALLARPYVWASAGLLELRSCRFRAEAPLGVALASAASAAEARLLDAALASLTGVGPGVRFERASEGPLRVRFVAGAVVRADGSPGTGRTVADCRLEPGGGAALVAADVEIARTTPPDWRGATRPLGEDELAGVLLHELAHALGVAGHAARGDSLLSAEPEAVRRAGRRALAGEPSRSPALAALYARPAGEVLVRRPLEAWRTAELDRLAALAARRGLDGPYLRAGDVSGQILWRDRAEREWGFRVHDLAGLARDPAGLLLVPDAAAREALARAR